MRKKSGPRVAIADAAAPADLQAVRELFREYAVQLGVDNACEMKRLYVRAGFRGLGLGRLLAQALMDRALQAGYATLLLDTLDDMEAARGLYESLGFEEIPPYYFNPIAGAHYLKADLDGAERLR